jgi:hypothetical protein
MRLKRILLGIVFSLILLPIGSCQTLDLTTGNEEMETELVHMTVNDESFAQNDAFALIEPVWWTGNIYGSVEEYEESLRQFSKPQRFLFAIHWYIAEVDNGGHDQFYYNSTGIVWPDALAGFDALGLDEAVAIIEESMSRMGGQPSRIRSERQDQLNRFSAEFDDLDNRLYALEEEIDLNVIMVTYASENASSFYFDGEVEVIVFP